MALRMVQAEAAGKTMDISAASDRRATGGALLLGLGLGGFFDGIVFHQLLEWHHMLSHLSGYSPNTLQGLKDNTRADGFFHAACWLLTVAGLLILWSTTGGQRRTLPMGSLIGWLLVGWGAFNVVEGVIDHEILELHHVREVSRHPALWDIAFLVWGATMVIAGLLLTRNRAFRGRMLTSIPHEPS